MIEKNSAALAVSGGDESTNWARALLRTFAPELEPPPVGRSEPHSLAWARSGSMLLTGRADAPPRLAPAPIAARAEGALRALQTLAGNPRELQLDGASMLAERAALLGLERNGAISASGSCRLLPAQQGWLAVNLARPDDWSLLPAWLGDGAGIADSWEWVASRLADWDAGEALARARLLSLPVAPVAAPPLAPPGWCRVPSRGTPRSTTASHRPLVLDLSSLWAGPLCTRLMRLAGARVIKVESSDRPDGARSGVSEFFDLLNAHKQSVALDFHERGDLARLQALIERADIVVESARPRALGQLGIDAGALVKARPGLTWLSITGYGRSEAHAQRVAFGDDASAAAGLTAATGDENAPLFCGDAIADPLTGLHAAVAAFGTWRAGGGALLDVNLRDTTACVLAAECSEPATSVEVRRDAHSSSGWEVVANGTRQAVLAARTPTADAVAPTLGADTDSVLREFGAC